MGLVGQAKIIPQWILAIFLSDCCLSHMTVLNSLGVYLTITSAGGLDFLTVSGTHIWNGASVLNPTMQMILMCN